MSDIRQLSPPRRPAVPPAIEGFVYLQLLGSGGFADVFLYEQQLPRRRVAVKVLVEEQRNTKKLDYFRDEANLMAQLSTHPAIVTIHQAAVAEGGRPYLVMEYCPKPNFGQRFRTEQIGIEEVLASGIQIAGAVETAHRAGILHRDIKPANILLTEYNHPALTDFGVAGLVGAPEGPSGLSVPWSPPELFASPPISRAVSDVWSLGATVYALLAGRAPFEVADPDDSLGAMANRIRSTPLSPVPRDDVPVSLQEVLATAMAKSPHARYTSALSFGRALQQVQEHLGIPMTPIDVLDDAFAANRPSDDDSGRTRVRPVHPAGRPPAGSAPSSAVPAPLTGSADLPTAALLSADLPTAALQNGDVPTAALQSADRSTADLPAADRPSELSAGFLPANESAEVGHQPADIAARALFPPGAAGQAQPPTVAYSPNGAPRAEPVRTGIVGVPTAPIGVRPAPGKSRVPGILLDVALVLAVVTAATYLVLTK